MFSISHEGDDQWADALADREGTQRQKTRHRLVAMRSAAVPILEELIQDSRFQVPWEAALAMKELAYPSFVDPLLEALKDGEGDVRWVAAEGLGAIGAPAIGPLLHLLIKEGDSFELRDAAHVVISLLDDEELRAVLMPVYRALVDRNPPEAVMAEASRALEALKGVGAHSDTKEAGLPLPG